MTVRPNQENNTDPEQFRNELDINNASKEYIPFSQNNAERVLTKKEKKKAYDRKRYLKNREKILAHKKEKYAENPEASREKSRLNWKKQYGIHRDRFIDRSKKYQKENSEQVSAYNKKRNSIRKDWLADYHRLYMQSPTAKTSSRQRTSRRKRELGFNPINTLFEDAEFHHMYLNGDNGIGIFIPHDIHRSIKHNGKTKKGIKESNKAALLWLCNQDTINIPGSRSCSA